MSEQIDDLTPDDKASARFQAWTPVQRKLDRRRLLGRGGIAAAGGIAVAMGLHARPAGALPGDPGWGNVHGTGSVVSGGTMAAGDYNLASDTDATTIASTAPGSFALQGLNRDGSVGGGGVGVFGESWSTTRGVGVYGLCQQGTGVYGQSDAVTGHAFAAGVVGDSATRPGVAGFSDTTTGVYGQSSLPTGLTMTAGVVGDAIVSAGVGGLSRDAAGVHGVSTNSNALFGEVTSGSNGFNAVYGRSAGTGNGIFGELTSATNAGNAVLGITPGTGTAVLGLATAGATGVLGRNDGSGPAMAATITKATNTANALACTTLGTGSAIVASSGTNATSPVVKSTSTSAQPAVQAVGKQVPVSATVPIAGNAAALRVQGVATFTRSGSVALAAPATSVVVSVPGGLSTASNVLATIQSNTPNIAVRAAVPNTATGKITIYFTAAAPVGTKVAWFVFG